MATTITSECINCGACEPECPNTAIYAGGVPWKTMAGEEHPAIAQDIFYIVPSKCTECVGFYDHEACAAVCPVDCCVPDPKNVESEAILLARARELHPDKTIADDAPSRFRKEGGGEAAPAPAEATAANGAAAPSAAPKPAAAPKAAAAPAAVAAGPAAPLAMLNLPKDVGALPGPIGEKHFAGEAEADFETVMASVDAAAVRSAPIPVCIALRIAEPVLGAMPDGVKRQLEDSVGTPLGFSRIRATALNLILNLILYPAILAGFGVALLGDELFSQGTSGWVLLGVAVAVAEAAWRLREGILHAKPVSEMIYRGCWYGLALAPIGAMLAKAGGGSHRVDRKVAFDGYEVSMHDDKLERDRRYGTVYTVKEFANAYLVRLEMPRKLPHSSLKRLWNLPDEMPDYDYNIALADGVLSINASVRGEALRRLSYVSSSFPADFATRIDFGKPVSSFKHRLKDKMLDVIVMKGEGAELQAAA
ncbi:MAG TPA: 4Fe-4S dicluster domain-containing protein [Candidatus Binataceae bacterium]|nr:4Fe-4S dicluster domain-containing protein [Candidatus Binataceae bacterium]